MDSNFSQAILTWDVLSIFRELPANDMVILHPPAHLAGDPDAPSIGFARAGTVTFKALPEGIIGHDHESEDDARFCMAVNIADGIACQGEPEYVHGDRETIEATMASEEVQDMVEHLQRERDAARQASNVGALLARMFGQGGDADGPPGIVPNGSPFSV